MDRKTIIILIICLGLVMCLRPLSQKLFPDIPLPAQATNSLTHAGTNSAGAYVIPSMGAADTAWLASPDSNPANNVVVNGDHVRYTFTPDGGGLELVELTKYPQIFSHQSRTNPAEGGLITLNTPIAAPTLAIRGLGGESTNDVFTLTRTANGVRADKIYPDGLRVTKDFETGPDYLVHTTVRFENTSGKELIIPTNEWVVGTAVPMDPNDLGANIGLMWYNGSRKSEIPRAWFNPKSLFCTPLAPRTKYAAGNDNVAWAVAENQYFALAAVPATPAAQVIARTLELPLFSAVDPSLTNATLQGIQTVLVYPGFALAPGQSTNTQVTLYTGPKEYKTLSRIANHMDNNLDQVMGFGTISGPVSKALLLTMNGLHALDIPYGWVIIAMTILLKLLLWPFTAASMRTAKAMSGLQPEMQKIREKYKEDPLKMQAKTNELWKEHGVHPLNGCLPTAIQIPIFIGFFYMIRTAIELRGAHFLWISDLSRPDTIFIVPGLGLHVNFLPLLYIVTALWQTHVQPPSPGMDPGQQKLMRWMPLMFLAILYNYSSGLALYMMVSNLLTILQTKLTRAKLNAAPPGGSAPPAPVLTHPPKKRK